MANNAGTGELFEGIWGSAEDMEMFDRLPRPIREAIAYADNNYSIEEIYTSPFFRDFSREELVNFIWENSDGFEIRYPNHVRVQYERARAASYRNRYERYRTERGFGLDILYGSDSPRPLRFP